MSVNELFRLIEDADMNVTFTGGDPMLQPEGITELAKAIKANSQKTIWCYSGYTFEEIVKNEKRKELLGYIDILVDGRFVQELKDESLYFRGSSNQRLIDVKASLAKGEAVIYDYEPKIKDLL